eukprot:g25725.t1
MADHIARNGADFEATVKQKNANNPQFAFLYNGEGSVYYQQVLPEFEMMMRFLCFLSGIGKTPGSSGSQSSASGPLVAKKNLKGLTWPNHIQMIFRD